MGGKGHLEDNGLLDIEHIVLSLYPKTRMGGTHLSCKFE